MGENSQRQTHLGESREVMTLSHSRREGKGRRRREREKDREREAAGTRSRNWETQESRRSGGPATKMVGLCSLLGWRLQGRSQGLPARRIF